MSNHHDMKDSNVLSCPKGFTCHLGGGDAIDDFIASDPTDRSRTGRFVTSSEGCDCALKEGPDAENNDEAGGLIVSWPVSKMCQQDLSHDHFDNGPLKCTRFEKIEPQEQRRVERPKFRAPPTIEDNNVSYAKFFVDEKKSLAKGNPSFKELRQNIQTFKELNGDSYKSMENSAGDSRLLLDDGVTHHHESNPKRRACRRSIGDKKALVDLDFEKFIGTQNIKLGHSQQSSEMTAEIFQLSSIHLDESCTGLEEESDEAETEKILNESSLGKYFPNHKSQPPKKVLSRELKKVSLSFSLPRRQNRPRSKENLRLTRSASSEDLINSYISSTKRLSQVLTEIERIAKYVKINEWLRSFYHFDPRWQILTFFNDLAFGGANRLRFNMNCIIESNRMQLPLMLRAFTRAGVFSVWRPTSSDAIRKMMTGEGTGKGLDIKGKSARRGKYSGYVPFLQIHKNEEKAKVGSMTADKRVRVFYPNVHSRDEAARVLETIVSDMTNSANRAGQVVEHTRETETKIFNEELRKSRRDLARPGGFAALSRSNSKQNGIKLALAASRRRLALLDYEKFSRALSEGVRCLMADPRVYKIDDYASTHNVFGLDMPEKLFWESYVMRNNITRAEGSDYDSGRPSIPAFQKMNINTLRNGGSHEKEKSVDPRPVLWHAGCGRVGESSKLNNCDPLNPLDLLMAYEENGKVTPVVSDFDCFLLGTRGVQYDSPMGEQELFMLASCVDEIEGILSTPQNGESWTSRWLEVKKKQAFDERFQGEMPQFGYADPTSYSIMKGAVHRLRRNGAVRHGPECFNYGFPQELDDKFLIISDNLPGNISWKYVNEKELLEFLSSQVDSGFTFPLNPKWILCDDGWKEIYDKLWASQMENVKESMQIWYPDHVRKRIDSISKQYPAGFTSVSGSSPSVNGITSGIRADLADDELRRYKIFHEGRRKLAEEIFSREETRDKSTSGGILFTAVVSLIKDAKEDECEQNTGNDDSSSCASICTNVVESESSACSLNGNEESVTQFNAKVLNKNGSNASSSGHKRVRGRRRSVTSSIRKMAGSFLRSRRSSL